MSARTEDCQGGVGGDDAGRVLGSAAVHAHVLQLHVRDEKHVIVGHDVHASFTCGGEVRASVLLPSDLWVRVAAGGTLEAGRGASPDGNIVWYFGEGWQHCKIQTIRLAGRKS